jgi:hypothetical protein
VPAGSVRLVEPAGRGGHHGLGHARSVSLLGRRSSDIAVGVAELPRSNVRLWLRADIERSEIQAPWRNHTGPAQRPSTRGGRERQQRGPRASAPWDQAPARSESRTSWRASS